MLLSPTFTPALIATAIAAGLVFAALGYVASHYWSVFLFGSRKKSIFKNKKDAKQTRLARLVSTVGMLAACFGIALTIAHYAVSLWGETLGLAATVGLSLGIVLSYLADSKNS